MTNKENQNIFDVIKYDEKGLIPAIVQNYEDNQILMFAWMNQESLKLTLKTNFANYFSRSRNKLWKKGEISGQVQEIKEILIDCDSDCLILKVIQKGVACHTGTKSCFFRNVADNGTLLVNQKPQISSNILYNKLHS